MVRSGCILHFPFESFTSVPDRLGRLPFSDVWTVSAWYHLGYDPRNRVTDKESDSSSTNSRFPQAKDPTLPKVISNNKSLKNDASNTLDDGKLY